MRLNPIVIVLWLAAATLATICQEGAAQEKAASPAGAEPFALSDTAAVQDITPALGRYQVDLGAGAGGAAVRHGDGPWFGLKLANPTSLPMERLVVVRRPLLAGAGWSVGTSSALPQAAAVEWVGPAAPEALPAMPGTGGASGYPFMIPAGGTASLAIPGAEGPVVAAVMTRSAYTGSTSFRFVILGLGFGLLGALAALSFARWLGAGDRAAAASAGIGLAAIWVLATQFGHHLPLIGAESWLDPGLKAAGLFLLAGALLSSVRMQAALSDYFLRALTWAALVCAALAAVALPVPAVAVAAGPVLLAAALLSLGAEITDALNHTKRLSVRLPHLISLAVLTAVLLAAGVLAAAEPSLAADGWSVVLYGAMIVSLAVLGGSGLVVHHGVAVPLLTDFHPHTPERPEGAVSSALGPEPAGADLSALELTPKRGQPPASPEPVVAGGANQGEDDLLRDLREAVAKREIGVEYQPIVALSNGSVAGFEALARWDRKGHGSVPPGVFIPLAEQAGLIGELGGHVLEEAARRLGEWQGQHVREHGKLQMNVNLSARQLDETGLSDRVKAVIEREKLEPQALTLELTETAEPDDPERAAETLQRLKDLGVRLVLDDFGTGHASLDVLRRLSFDGLKIAHPFVADAGNERGRRIVETIIGLAHGLGMTVTAEGVREAADLERLRKMGCEYVQGPFCGAPLPAASAESVLRRGGAGGSQARGGVEPFSAGSA